MKILSLFAALLLAGCTHPLDNPFNVNKALSGIFSDLKENGAISYAEIDNRTATQYVSVDAALHNAQCINHLADPIVAIIPRNITLVLRRQFSSQSQWSALGVLLQPIPEVALAGQITLGQQQNISLPVTFSYLSNIPSIIQYYAASIRDSNHDISLDEEDVGNDTIRRRKLVTSKLADTKEIAFLKDHINNMIANFDPKNCH